MKNFKKVLALVLSVAMVLGTMTMAFGQTIVPAELYSDVTADNATAVAKLKAVKVLDGYADGTIRLENTLTRAEMAKTIVALLGLAEGVALNSPNTTTFTDVNGHWAAGWISIATGQGIIKGHANGKFQPEDKITEEQAVAMIIRALEWGPIVAGNYPYGENAKAMELNIVRNSPVYGKDATRGYVFAAAAEALTAPMASRSAVVGNVNYEGEKTRTLLVDRLGFKAQTEVVVDKTARMERELDKNEFRSGNTTFVYKNEDFDATAILGEVVNVWYDVNDKNKDNEVIFVEIDPVDSTKITGVVSESKKNEIKLENGRTYKLEDATVYVDNVISSKIDVGSYVTLTLNKKNDVVYADVFDLTASDLTSTLDLVTKISKAQDNRFEFYNQNNIRRDFHDEKLIVYKDGKLASTNDIKEYDLVKAIKLGNQAKTTFVYVTGEATGSQKLDRVNVDGTVSLEDRKVVIKLEDGTTKEVDMNNFIIADTNFKGGTYGISNDGTFTKAVDALKDLIGKDVVLVTVPTGKVKAIVGKVDAKKVEAALAYQVGNKYSSYDKGLSSIRFIDQANEKVEREFKTVDGTNKIYVAKKIDNETEIIKDRFVGPTGDKVGKTTVFLGGTPGTDSNKLEVQKYFDKKDGKQALTVEDGYSVDGISNYTLKLKEAKNGKKIFNITDSTVVFNLTKDSDGYEAKKYGDIKDSKIDGVEVDVMLDKDTEGYNTPTASVIVVTKGRFVAKDKDAQYGIVVYASRGSDATYFTINDGDKNIEYAASKDAKFVSAGNAIKFSQTGKQLKDLPEISKDSIEVGTGGYVTRIRGNVYTLDGTQYEVASKFFSMNDGLFSDGKSNRASYFIVDGKLRVLNFLRNDQNVDVDGLADAKTFEGLTGFRQAKFDGVKYEITASVEKFLEKNEIALEGQKLVIAKDTTLIRRIEGIELLDGSRTIYGDGFVIYGNVIVKKDANNRTIENLEIDGDLVQYAKNLTLENVTVRDLKVETEEAELTLIGTTEVKNKLIVKAKKVNVVNSAQAVEKVAFDKTEYAETFTFTGSVKVDDDVITGNTELTAEKKVTVVDNVYTIEITMNKEIVVAKDVVLKDKITTAKTPATGVELEVQSASISGKVIKVVVKANTLSTAPIAIETFTVTIPADSVKDLAGKNGNKVIEVTQADIK